MTILDVTEERIIESVKTEGGNGNIPESIFRNRTLLTTLQENFHLIGSRIFQAVTNCIPLGYFF